MLTLIAFTPVMFNFRTVFRIGIYDIEEDFLNTYSDGEGGVNLKIELTHEVNNRYTIRSSINPKSTEDVINYGLLYVNIQFLRDNESKFGETLSYSNPSEGFSGYTIFLDLFQDSNFTCEGTAEVALQADGVPKNETVNFQLSFFPPLNREDFINIDLAIYSLFFVYFFLYIIIPLILLKIFKPVLGLKYREEDAKKDEKYLNFIKGKAKEKRNDLEMN
jgi:hypothetical protein